MPLTPSDVPEFDPHRVSAARRHNDLLGGKDNFAHDRQSAAALTKALPSLPIAIKELRRCMLRQVAYLAECGVRQFLDIGCGFPLEPNVHDVAQGVDPASRVVYVDSDVHVGATVRALVVGTGEGAVEFVAGDLADIDAILADDVVLATLDFDRPVGVLMAAVLHFITDDKVAGHAVDRVKEVLAPGSYLALTHITFDPLPAAKAAELTQLADGLEHGPFRARTHAEVEAFLDGMELVDPGVVPTVLWHPGMSPAPTALMEEAVAYAGVAKT